MTGCPSCGGPDSPAHLRWNPMKIERVDHGRVEYNILRTPSRLS